MLWFRTATVVTSAITLVIAVVMLASVLIMCVNPSNGRAMNTDPYYNGTLGFYIVVIFSEMLMLASSVFGLILSFRIWRNNHQLDHKLRRLFSIWLATLCMSSLVNFVMGILGLVRYREAQEEIMSLFEIFAKYNQDVKFVGSFERYQRENSCCGINGPDDWMLAQFKQGGGGGGGMSGMSGGMDSYMGSPSTGKCHLTPPTIPMGCGKKMMEDIHWTQTCYSAILLLETLTGIATAALGWYCFFYWIEKEVIIIPEDEVSNLIVIEPESSISEYSNVTDYSAMSGSMSRSMSGSQYSNYSRPYSQSRYGSQSRYSRMSGSRGYPSANPYAPEGSFYPNTPRPQSPSKFTKISNIHGALPSIGGPHSAYLSMQMVDPNDQEDEINQNTTAPPSRLARSVSEAVEAQAMDGIQLHQEVKSIVYPVDADQNPPMGQSMNFPGSQSMFDGSALAPSYNTGSFRGSGSRPFGTSTRASTLRSGSYFSKDSALSQKPKEKKYKKVKKEHSANHMLHKQEKALGGRVLAELRIDHSRDPQPMHSNMSTSHVKKGHRAHHATLALIKNKHPPGAQELFPGPEKGHGQTGHLANDILAMSGGAAAAKSMIDNINLRVEHDSSLLEGEGYLKKMRREKKKANNGMQDHPDKHHPGHGPVMAVNGVVQAPSADGSQAQLLLDNILNVGHEPPPKESSEEVIPVHDVKEKKEDEEENKKGKHHHGKHHHGHSHHGHHHHHNESGSLRHGHHHHYPEFSIMTRAHHNHSQNAHSHHHGHHHSRSHHPHHHGHHHSRSHHPHHHGNHSAHHGHHHHGTHHHGHHNHRSHHHNTHHRSHHGQHHGAHHDRSMFFPGSMAGSSMQPGSMAASSLHPGSMAARSMHPRSMAASSLQPGSMAGGSMQPGSIAGGSLQPGSVAGGSMAGASQFQPQTEVLFRNDHSLE